MWWTSGSIIQIISNSLHHARRCSLDHMMCLSQREFCHCLIFLNRSMIVQLDIVKPQELTETGGTGETSCLLRRVHMSSAEREWSVTLWSIWSRACAARYSNAVSELLCCTKHTLTTLKTGTDGFEALWTFIKFTWSQWDSGYSLTSFHNCRHQK